MEYRWSLKALYEDFNDPAFAADLKALEQTAEQLKALTDGLEQMDATEALRQGILLEEKGFLLHNRLNRFARLSRAADARNSEANSAIGRVDQAYGGMAGPRAAFYRWACTLPDLMQRVEQDEILKEYGFLFARKQRESSHQLPGAGEELLAKLAPSGYKAWTALYSFSTGSVQVPWKDGTVSLPAICKMAWDPDRQVRKAAFEAELASYDKIRDAVAHCLNAQKLETLTECQLRGYDSPLDMTLDSNKISKKTLDAMFQTVREGLPVLQRYLKAKAKLLGYEGGLPWYDLFAPVGDSSRKYSVEEARDYLISLFTEFDSQEGQMMELAFREKWIDFYPRAGKAGGATCYSIPAIGESRINLNFGENFAGIKTLAHELGHAFHHLCIKAHRPLNKTYGMCLAETASNMNERVLFGAAIENAKTPEEKLALLEKDLASATMSVCDIYSRFLFESRVFENRRQRFMSADTLAGFMMDAQKQAYGDGLDENCLHPYMWIQKSHYYGSTLYNYPYAFGELLSRGLYARYLREGKQFVPKYKDFLYATPVATAEDAAKVAGIDLTDRAFWQDAMGMLEAKVEQFCALAEKER